MLVAGGLNDMDPLEKTSNRQCASLQPNSPSIRASSTSASSHCPPLTNGGGDAGAARIFELTVNFFPSKGKLVDGSVQNIERDTIVKWEVQLADIDPQELLNMEENAVHKFVEKIGESVCWVQSKSYHCCGSIIGRESM